MTPEEFEKSIDTVGSGTQLEASYRHIIEARFFLERSKPHFTGEKLAMWHLDEAARIIAEIQTEQEAQP